MQLITVRATRSDRRVLLWERDPRHPDGEVFLSADGGAQTHEVFPTGAVAALLTAGLLVKVEPGPNPAPVRDLAPAPAAKPSRRKR